MNKPIDLQAFNRVQYGQAKRTWTAANVLAVLAFVVGLVATLLDVAPLSSTLIAGALAVIGWLVTWRADTLKGQAEEVRRALDLQDALALPVPRALLADLEVQYNVALNRDVSEEKYFASTAEPGLQRLVENVRETAFWSSHQARIMARLLFSVTAVGLLVAVAALLESVRTVEDIRAVREVATGVAAAILFVLTGGLARLAGDYHAFAGAACRARDGADAMLEGTRIDPYAAARLGIEYATARAGAPLLPQWVYRWKGAAINAAWNRQYGPEAGER